MTSTRPTPTFSDVVTTLAHDPLVVLPAPAMAWAVVSPFVLGFDSSHAAVASHIALTVTIVPLGFVAAGLRPAAWFVVALAALLGACPFLLDYARSGTWAWASDLVVSGTLIVATIISLRTRERLDRVDGDPVEPAK